MLRLPEESPLRYHNRAEAVDIRRKQAVFSCAAPMGQLCRPVVIGSRRPAQPRLHAQPFAPLQVLGHRLIEPRPALTGLAQTSPACGLNLRLPVRCT